MYLRGTSIPNLGICKKRPGFLEVVSLDMSYSLNSLKGGYIGDYIGTTIGDIKGDTKSLEYSSYVLHT